MDELLDNLQTDLEQNFSGLDIFCLNEVDSTSRYLKSKAVTSISPAFCFSHSQVSGYGQQERVWKSDQSSLTFSLLLDFSVAVGDLDGLTQLIVLNIIQSLSDYSNQAYKIKWPNDLYVEGCKAGGILVECVSYTDMNCRLVIGIGLNNGLSLPISDIHTNQSVLPGTIDLNDDDRNSFLINVIDRLLMLSQTFHSGMFQQYLVNYALVDYFDNGQSVNVYDNGFTKTGVYRGLTQHGELLVEVNGKLFTYRSGSVSIRPTN
ncbi:MAG: biotin--[acetyl-CoA-carboxylase] ligase [Pseudomonadota bacterium]|nr:biotin--[acetyl-CoA-carboxylase] ligase [Pseudomonadota bacterium]